MKLSLDWLEEFVSIPWSREDLSHRLTMAGFEVEGDEVNITPNRGDVLSILGLAREISALQGKPLRFKKTTPPKGRQPIRDIVQVQVIDCKGCPRYMARAILGVTIKPSPDWMQRRLSDAGLRPVNNVVDCTNYVMWKLGHPLHAFDHRFLRQKKIVVRPEPGATRFKTLDGETRMCEPTDLFICDGEGPAALAGIMGGANSEVRDDTKDVVIEAATFDPQKIHATAKRLKLSTESSYRFERGVDPNGVEHALHRVVALILETAGGQATKDWIDIYPQKITPKKIAFSIGEVERILGTKISPAKIRKLLEALGFQIRGTGTTWQVSIPTYRFDMSRSIDLVEEIARQYGFENIPETLPQIQVGGSEEPKETRCLEKTIDVLLRFGFSQTCHLSFVSAEEAAVFANEPNQIVAMSNPLSQEQECLRSSLLPGLLKAAAFNAHRQVKDLKLFELGKVFTWADAKVSEQRKLAFVAFGQVWPQQWGLKKREADFFFLKGMLQQWTAALHLPPLEFLPQDFSSASLNFQGKNIGWMGLFDPAILKKWEIKIPVYGCELDWEILAAASQKTAIAFQPISKFPFVERDIALIVDQTLSAKKLEETIWGANITDIQKIKLFDVYQGEGLEGGKKSLAVNVVYASPERTLTNDEVNQAHETLIRFLEKNLNAQLR